MSEQSNQKTELYAAASSLIHYQEVLPAIIEVEKKAFEKAKKMIAEHEENVEPEHLERLQKTVLMHKENVELFITLQKATRAIDQLQINWLCRKQALEFASGRTAKTSPETKTSGEFIDNHDEPEATKASGF